MENKVPATQPAQGAAPKAAKSILLVDDDEQIHQFVRSVLSKYVLEIVSVGNGRDALSEMRIRKYDLIMLDLMMPEFTGGDVMREIHTLELPMPTILIMSSMSDDDLVRNCLQVGATDFIVKPASPETIRKKVTRLLLLDEATNAV